MPKEQTWRLAALPKGTSAVPQRQHGTLPATSIEMKTHWLPTAKNNLHYPPVLRDCVIALWAAHLLKTSKNKFKHNNTLNIFFFNTLATWPVKKYCNSIFYFKHKDVIQLSDIKNLLHSTHT